MSGQCKCGSRAINDDPDSLLCDRCWRDAEIERLREQLREQTKSFCTHCGKLFPKGRDGIAAFLEHIAECNEHPLHPMAKQLSACRCLLREALQACEVYLPVVPDDQTRVALLTRSWYEAARAAGGDS